MEKEIIMQTIKVRKLQRDYFHYRDRDILKAAKSAEVALDKMLHDYVQMIPGETTQLNLFTK